MNVDWIFLAGIVAAIFPRRTHATIMCSKCRSDNNPNCELEPPSPVTCVGSGSGVTESCSIIRIFEKKSGKLDQFIRSCSNSKKTGCFDSTPGFRTCALVCHTDGCNSAPSSISGSKLYIYVFPLFIVCHQFLYSTFITRMK